jgi:hypothetical protein
VIFPPKVCQGQALAGLQGVHSRAMRPLAPPNRRSSPAPARTAPGARTRHIAAPGQHPVLAQPLQRRGNPALARVRIAGDRRIGRVEPDGHIEEIEDQRVQHLERRMAERAAVMAGPAGLPVEVPSACRIASR